jgi:hypothetical protein
MKAFLIAAGIASIAAPAFAIDVGVVEEGGFKPSIFAAACTRLGVQVAQDHPVQFKSLQDLPPAVLEHAVYRLIGGCPVREVRWHGQTVFVAPQVGDTLPRLDMRPAQRDPGAVTRPR